MSEREALRSEKQSERMAFSESDIWQQIDLSESYLVCCMFEEAASKSSSIIREICSTTFREEVGQSQIDEIMESAGMVFIQSLKELGRTSEVFIELGMMFGSVAKIPVQVFLTGACMQISEGSPSNLKAIFEEFLDRWTHVEAEVYALKKAIPESSSSEGCTMQPIMHAERYVEVAEVYSITYLGMVLHQPDLAIAWTERANIPEEKRQDILRKLQSLTRSGEPSSVKEASSEDPKRRHRANRDTSKAISLEKSGLEISKKASDPFFWWLRVIRLKLNNAHSFLPRVRVIFFVLLMLFGYHTVRKRSAVLKRFLARQASSMRRALVDAWQLAFSVQVNPLAAVQQLPSPPLGR